MKSTQSYTPEANPLLSDPHPKLTLRGDRQSGGPLEAVVQGKSVYVELTAAQWTVVAEFFSAAIRAEHWNDAYVSSPTLIEQLEHFDVSDTPTGQTVHKIINSLRSRLAAGIQPLTNDAAMDPMSWAKLLIHNRKRCGYRITVPHHLLTVYIDKHVHSVETLQNEGDGDGDNDGKASPKPK